MEEKKKQLIPLRYEIVFAVGITLIAFFSLGLTWFMLFYFGIDLKSLSFFLAYRTLLTLFFSMIAVPVTIFAEFVIKQWKKRSFLWKNVFVGIGMLCIFAMVTFFLLTVFDILVSDLDLIWQIPLVACSNSIGLIMMGIATRTRVFKKWLRNV
jgi:hypothetical protein